jgi:hypothetical protein
MNASQLDWGIRDPDLSASALWGARCIINVWSARELVRRPGERGVSEEVEKRALDILWDRQRVQGDTDELAQAFSTFLNTADGPVDQLREAVARGEIRSGDYEEDKVVVVVFGGVQFHCRPSGGYLHITARRVTSEVAP